MTGAERATVTKQLGRDARGDNAVVHRCEWGLPTVVRVAPQLEDGTPFPTVFWLTCPLLRSKVGSLETEGVMADLTQQLGDDAEKLGEYEATAERYVSFRDRLGDPLPSAAGGMPNRVKCLHVHVAHHLATGDNWVGEWALNELTPMACPGPCVEDSDS